MRIVVLYTIDKSWGIKYSNWSDGFTKAIKIVSNSHDVHIFNSADNPHIDFNQYDIVMFKESFCGHIYQKYKKLINGIKLGLFISASNIIPTMSQLNVYDILFYETQWYYKYASLNRHKHAYHAFGIDTSIMAPQNVDKQYDVLFVGMICGYKRPLNILKKEGSKICIGHKSDISLVEQLQQSGVIVQDFIKYTDLCFLYNQSRLCYIPCELHGGGERAVLEARSCGIPVEIEPDNPKLQELLESPIYSGEYYAQQINYGLSRLNIYHDIQKLPLDYSTLLQSLKHKPITILQVGGMDGSTFDPLYRFIQPKWTVIILEPIQYQYNKLVNTYKHMPNVITINKALAYSNASKMMYTIGSNRLESAKSNKWEHGISSFYTTRNALSEVYWKTRGKVHTHVNFDIDIKPHIEEVVVECITIDEIKNQYNINHIDILQSDTEGYDFNVVKIVLGSFMPYIINFEWNNLPEDELCECKQLLDEMYDNRYYHQDALYKIK